MREMLRQVQLEILIRKKQKEETLTSFFYSVNFSDKNFKSQREQLEFLKNHGFNVCDFIKYFDIIDELKEIIDNVSNVRSTLIS